MSAKQSLYRRLDERLQAQCDDAGPVRGHYSLGRIFMIWLAANLVVTTLLTGTLFVPAVPYWLVIGLILGGTVVGASVVVAVGAIGTRTGLATMALTRAPFGTRGSLLPVVANVVILMGWSWVQAMLAGIAFNYIVQSLTGYSSPVICAVLCQSAVVILAVFGHRGVARIEPWFAAVILAIAAYVFAAAFSAFTPAEFAAIPTTPASGYTPGLVFDVVLATAISWTVLSADFNRYAASTRAGAVGSGIGYTLSTVIAMTLGATAIGYVILRGGQAITFDPVTIVQPFGAAFAAAIFLSVMATNTMVVYGIVTTVVNALPGKTVRFLPTAILFGGVSIVGSTFFGLLDQFTAFLTTISALFAPVFAIMIADYYLISRGSYAADILEARGGRYWYTAGVNWLAIAAWAAGAGLSYAWTHLWPLSFGATVPAFISTFALYLALARRRGHTHVEPSRNLAEVATPSATGNVSNAGAEPSA